LTTIHLVPSYLPAKKRVRKGDVPRKYHTVETRSHSGLLARRDKPQKPLLVTETQALEAAPDARRLPAVHRDGGL
jgi:hypothetical protein